MARLILGGALLALTAAAIAAEPIDDKAVAKSAEAVVWKLTAGIDTPVCAYIDPRTQALFISNVAGPPQEKGGKGYITKADANGKVLAGKWIDGLASPKGMCSHAGSLWVSDFDQLLAIDIQTAKITQRVKIDGAKFLNDVAIDDAGTVYVSDTLAGIIYAVKDGKPSVFVEGEETVSPYGLLVHDQKLVVAGWGFDLNPKTFETRIPGTLFEFDLQTKRRDRISTRPLGNLDGVMMDGSGGYYVSDNPAGRILHLADDGSVSAILQHGKGGTANFAIWSDKLLIVPLTKDNAVIAYDLEKLLQ